ncbi:hypothetical protein VIGAN_01157400, partial [Vigna angularis var. angularis]
PVRCIQQEQRRYNHIHPTKNCLQSLATWRYNDPSKGVSSESTATAPPNGTLKCFNALRCTLRLERVGCVCLCVS